MASQPSLRHTPGLPARACRPMVRLPTARLASLDTMEIDKLDFDRLNSLALELQRLPSLAGAHSLDQPCAGGGLTPMAAAAVQNALAAQQQQQQQAAGPCWEPAPLVPQQPLLSTEPSAVSSDAASGYCSMPLSVQRSPTLAQQQPQPHPAHARQAAQLSSLLRPNYFSTASSSCLPPLPAQEPTGFVGAGLPELAQPSGLSASCRWPLRPSGPRCLSSRVGPPAMLARRLAALALLSQGARCRRLSCNRWL